MRSASQERESLATAIADGQTVDWAAVEAAGVLSTAEIRALRELEALRRPPDAPVASLTPGQVVGDFELVARVGSGGMGEVWEAQQLSLARRVALKFVRPERVTPHQLDLFAREARAGGRLSHPGIVTIHGHGEASGRAWIAMEFVAGACTLKDFLDDAAREGELPQGYDRDVARLVAEIAEALQAAHEAGVIHRDVKPQNVLLTSDDRPKVTDFGLARITDELALSRTGEFAGTYLYMSPEQAMAKRIGLDHRTDVFSLGVVLYELLTLRRPFEGDTTHQVAEQVLYRDPPDPRTFRSRIPRDLAVIAGRALEKERDKRYATMQELAADLRRHLAHEPIRATPPTPLERTVKWGKRNPGKSSAAAIVAVAFAVISLLLAENVRTNRALARKTAEAEASAQEAQRQAEIARASEARALAGEAAAREHADEISRLSLLDRVEGLVAEADGLWPPQLEDVPEYESWIRRAQDLTRHLPELEARRSAIPLAQPAGDDELLLALEVLRSEIDTARAHLSFVRRQGSGASAPPAGGSPAPPEAPQSLALLCQAAFEKVGPERHDWDDEHLGLALARQAVLLSASDAFGPRLRSQHVLSLALLATGRGDEALQVVERALASRPSSEDLASAAQAFVPLGAPAGEWTPQGYEAWAAAWRAQVSAGAQYLLDPEQQAAQELEILQQISDLELRRATAILGEGKDLDLFTQLSRTLSALRLLADERVGLLGEGYSPRHHWGMLRRRSFALGASARDARRLADIELLQERIEAYRRDLGHCPAPDSNPAYGGWDVSCDGGFLTELIREGYLDANVFDPINDGQHHYRYYVYAGGAYGCVSPSGFYVLGVRELETAPPPQRAEGALSCSGRDWSKEFDHVVAGGIEAR